MTNQELYNTLLEIMYKNPLDAYCALKQLRKDYKRSEFYKATKLPLNKAYELVCSSLAIQLHNKLRELTDVEQWVAKLESFIDDLDENSVDNFINKIISSLRLDNLTKEQGELQDLLDQMKTLG